MTNRWFVWLVKNQCGVTWSAWKEMFLLDCKFVWDLHIYSNLQNKGNLNIRDDRPFRAIVSPAVRLNVKTNSLPMFLLVSFILVQKPAPVSDINVTPSARSAQVTLENPTPETSSYINYYSIVLDQQHNKGVKRFGVQRQRDGTKFKITELKPYTSYTVIIWAQDSSLQWSSAKSKEFMTSEAGK